MKESKCADYRLLPKICEKSQFSDLKIIDSVIPENYI